MVASRSALCSRALVVGAAALAMAAASPGQNPPANQQPPAYKSGVTIVPLDVRVLDKDGRPITDLRQEEFRILENGVPQTIVHFMAQALVADRPEPALRASTEARPFDATPQSRRVFLIVLGPGALGDVRVYPQTLNALLRFLRESLLPQDQVGLIAYNRAVDFTTDHEKIARLLEGFGRSTAGARAALARQGSLVAADMPSVFSDPPPLETPPSYPGRTRPGGLRQVQARAEPDRDRRVDGRNQLSAVRRRREAPDLRHRAGTVPDLGPGEAAHLDGKPRSRGDRHDSDRRSDLGHGHPKRPSAECRRGGQHARTAGADPGRQARRGRSGAQWRRDCRQAGWGRPACAVNRRRPASRGGADHRQPARGPGPVVLRPAIHRRPDRRAVVHSEGRVAHAGPHRHGHEGAVPAGLLPRRRRLEREIPVGEGGGQSAGRNRALPSRLLRAARGRRLRPPARRVQTTESPRRAIS